MDKQEEIDIDSALQFLQESEKTNLEEAEKLYEKIFEKVGTDDKSRILHLELGLTSTMYRDSSFHAMLLRMIIENNLVTNTLITDVDYLIDKLSIINKDDEKIKSEINVIKEDVNIQRRKITSSLTLMKRIVSMQEDFKKRNEEIWKNRNDYQN